MSSKLDYRWRTHIVRGKRDHDPVRFWMMNEEVRKRQLQDWIETVGKPVKAGCGPVKVYTAEERREFARARGWAA